MGQLSSILSDTRTLTVERGELSVEKPGHSGGQKPGHSGGQKPGHSGGQACFSYIYMYILNTLNNSYPRVTGQL